MHRFESAILAVFVIAKLALGIRSSLGSGILGPRVIVGADSELYLESAKRAIWSVDQWAGAVPPGYPLLIKLVGSHWRVLIAAQTAVSTFAWIYLALGVRQMFAVAQVRLVGFALVLATGLAATFQVWDVAIGTESLSLAATAVATGACCHLVVRDAGTRRLHGAAAVVAAMVAVLTRDANAVVVLLVAGFAGLGFARCREWRKVGAAFFLVVVAIGAIGLSTHGRRWYWQTVDLVAIRMVGDADAQPFMVARGLVINDAVDALHRDYGGNVIRLLRSDPDLDEYQAWIAKEGRSAYYAYFARNPRWLIVKPVAGRSDIMQPGLGGEGAKYGFDIAIDRPTRLIGALAFAEVGLLRWLVLSVTAVGALVPLFSRRARRSRALRCGAALLVIGIAHFWIVYHGDALEVARHAIGATMQLQLASILVVCGLLNTLAERKNAD